MCVAWFSDTIFTATKASNACFDLLVRFCTYAMILIISIWTEFIILDFLLKKQTNPGVHLSVFIPPMKHQCIAHLKQFKRNIYWQNQHKKIAWCKMCTFMPSNIQLIFFFGHNQILKSQSRMPNISLDSRNASRKYILSYLVDTS